MGFKMKEIIFNLPHSQQILLTVNLPGLIESMH